MLSLIHFEHGLPHLAGLDLGGIFQAQERAQRGEVEAIGEFLRSLAASGKSRAIRHLSAISHATVPELIAAEVDESAMSALLVDAAQRPFGDALQDAFGFFEGLGQSFNGMAPSSGPQKTSPKPAGKARKAK